MALYLEPLLGYLGNIVEAYVVSELSYTPWPPTQLPLSLCLPYRGKSWVPISAGLTPQYSEEHWTQPQEWIFSASSVYRGIRFK